ncbi:MAG: selenium metabolism-associated LysR family transcriptional regulator [bacterium]
MNIDIHHLEVFCTCAELGSFSEAAQTLGISQSTVSTHIKTVESEIGAQVFDRRKGRVHLTPVGEVLYRQGLKVIASRKEAMCAVNNFLGRIEGTIGLGASTIPASYILPEIIVRFLKTYPKVTVHMASGNTGSIFHDICLGRIELGAVGSTPDEEQFTSCIMGTDELLLTYSPAHFPQMPPKITLAQVMEFPLILREEGSGTRRLFENELSRINLSRGELQIVAELGSIEAVKRAVIAGLGISFIPKAALAFETRANMVKSVPLSDVRLTRNFYLVHLLAKTLSPPAQAFWDFVNNAV